MKIREITEARRNPKLNPKHGFTNEMIRRLKESDLIPGTSVENAFASFTSLEKLGINPSSEYDTPIGIYAYPLRYVRDEIGDRDTTWLPFAGDKPYVNFFSLKKSANILVSTKFTAEDSDRLYGKLYDLFGEEDVDAHYANSERSAFVKTAFGRFWYVTFMLSKEYGKNKPAFWNGLFRKIGVDAVLDLGDGVIHDNEPTQIVVFNPAVINGVERIRNVRTKETQEYASAIRHIAQRNDPKEIHDFIFDNRYEKLLLNKIPPKLVWRAIEEDPSILKFVNIPVELQKKVVDSKPQYIDIIRNLDIQTIKYAISKGHAAELATKPTLMAYPEFNEVINKAL